MPNHKPTLANDLAYATECNLATLSGLLMKKSSPKSEIRRQTSICTFMLQTCLRHEAEIDWGGSWQRHFGRVENILLATKKYREEILTPAKERAIDRALEDFVKEHSA